MLAQVWIAENRGKNKEGFELVIVNKHRYGKQEFYNKVWLKKISKKNVKELNKIGIEIEEG